jgi:hypothetical protein
MSPESRNLIRQLLGEYNKRLTRDREASRMLAVNYRPSLPLDGGEAFILARIDELSQVAARALSEIEEPGTPIPESRFGNPVTRTDCP